VLPGVNAEQGLELADNGVLVLQKGSAIESHHYHFVYGETHGIGADADLAGLLVLNEPSPARALNGSQSSVHLALERVEATVGGVDSLGQRAGGSSTTAGVLGSQVLPEEGVVKVATAVEVDGRLQSNLGGDVVLVLGLLELLNCIVVVGDIGVVVVLVVQLHDLAGDRGLQSTIVVWMCN